MCRLPHLLFATAFLALGSLPALCAAPAAGVLGQWRTPDGSVVAIDRCGSQVCARVFAVSAAAPTRLDVHNPEPTLRSRPICGLQIGRGFQLQDPDHAEGGKLYDPKSGKTYSGSINAEGNQLHLRGYVGLKMFGRSETWTRTSNPQAPCKA